MTAPPPSAPAPGEQPSGFRPPRRLTVTRVAALRSRQLVGGGVRRLGAASRADGAAASGLASLTWVHVVHYAADAMIAVSLAGTVFFSAARSEQRTNVALYLLVTMVPFALLAPVVGPLLDRMQRGRRLALAGTAAGRAVLAWVMAANVDNLALYPAAFGALVLSKAYGVLRGACVPRVLPPGMTLVSANARLSLFGLGSAAVAGTLLGGLLKVTGSYPWALRLTGVVFVAAAVLSLRLPAAVDSSAAEQTAVGGLPGAAGRGRRRSLGSHLVTALRTAAALRALSGFLTLFLAFLIQSTEHGRTAAVALGGLAAAAGGGSVLGTAAGARLTLSRPDPVLLGSLGTAAAACVVTSVSYSLATALLVALVAGVGNSLGKLCLDAIVQREVPDALRASAFARSETLLQLAWVFGGGLGIALPADGRIGFAVTTALLVLALVAILTDRRRAATRDAGHRSAGRGPADAPPTAES